MGARWGVDSVNITKAGGQWADLEITGPRYGHYEFALQRKQVVELREQLNAIIGGWTRRQRTEAYNELSKWDAE